MLDTAMGRHSPGDDEEMHLDAYNAAFYELGLKWHWSSDVYQSLQHHAGERERVREYLETTQPHLLRAYDSDFLVDAILAAKERCLLSLTACGARSPGKVNWAEIQRLEIGV